MFSQMLKLFERMIQEKKDYSNLSKIIYYKSEKSICKFNIKELYIMNNSELSEVDMINGLNNIIF